MSTVLKAFKLLLFPARLPVSLRAPIPHHRPFLPLFRFSSTTTSAPPPPQQERSYGKIPISIAGVQFYNGIANRGESLVLIREPANTYDRNAIRVDKADGTQVGYVPAYLARNIAPLVDEGLITVGMEATELRCVMQAASIEVFGVAKTEKRWRELCERGKETWGLWGTYGVAATSTMGLLGNAAEGLLRERMLREETVLDRENTDPLTPSFEANQKPTTSQPCYDYTDSSKVKEAPKPTPEPTPLSAKIITRTESMVVYGKIRAQIVWYMPYKVVTQHGEPIVLQREPGNQKHPHAIRADNAKGNTVGYIPFSLSARLAPYVDEGLIAIEGVAWKRDRRCPRCSRPLTIMIYGPAPKEKDIRAQLTEKGVLGHPEIWWFYAD